MTKKKTLGFMTSAKGTGVKNEKKKVKKDGDSDEEPVPYDQMTDEQKRIFDVNKFHRELDRSKNYFTAMHKSILPIVETASCDEASETVSKHEAQEGAQAQNTPQDDKEKVEQVEKEKKKKKKAKDSEELSGSEGSDDGLSEDDEDKKAKKE